MATFSIQSLNIPDHYVRHANFLGELSRVTSDQDRQDATFALTDGLADRNLISFRSRNISSHFLRHEGFRIKLHQRDVTFTPGEPPNPDQVLFDKDATFAIRPGLADPSGVSFRSLNFPDRYLRHRDLHLYVEPANDHQGRQDATFRIVNGFVPPPDPPR